MSNLVFLSVPARGTGQETTMRRRTWRLRLLYRWFTTRSLDDMPAGTEAMLQRLMQKRRWWRYSEAWRGLWGKW